MEDQKTTDAQQDAQQGAQPAEGTQKKESAWLEHVLNDVKTLTDEIDETRDTTRAIITIAVDKGMAAVVKAGGSLPLAYAVKEVLTGSAFAKHVADACRIMAADAIEKGQARAGSVVIEVDLDPEDDDGQQETEEDNEGEEVPSDE